MKLRHIYDNISLNSLLRTRNVTDKVIEENTILWLITFFPENRVLYQIMWKKYGSAREATDDIIWCMSVACRLTEATDTHLEYVKLIAFPQQVVTQTRLNITFISTLLVLF
jgi:hypothetical protein